MKKHISSLVLIVVAMHFSTINAQRALSEKVDYFDVRMPNNPFDESVKTYSVIVRTPYTLTVEQLNANKMAEFEEEKANFANIIKESKVEFEEKLANYDDEVKLAKERYDQEMKDFKSLTLLERLAITDQGNQPKLKTPAKPTYVEPLEPQYVQPNLDDHLIFDNQVLADGIKLLGYEKGKDILFIINISKMVFQDNAGQTFYSQPTTLKVMKGVEQINEKVFDNEFEFLTSSSSNTINLERYEKDNVKKIMRNINTYINDEFGYIPVSKTIMIEYPKNKKREYDNLENAKIQAISAYRKLNQDTSLADRAKAMSELEKVRDVWKSELEKVDYSDKKAIMNGNVSRIILFNLMRVDLTLKDRAQAEETLKLIQEHRIDLDLGYYEKEELVKLEEEVYKL